MCTLSTQTIDMDDHCTRIDGTDTGGEDLSLCLGDDVALGDDDDVSRLEERSDLFRRVDSREVVDDADSGDFLKIRGSTIAKPCGFGDQKIKSLAVSPVYDILNV